MGRNPRHSVSSPVSAGENGCSLIVNISKLAQQNKTKLEPEAVLLKIRILSKDHPNRSIVRGDIA